MKGLVIYATDISKALEIRGYLETQKGYRFDVKSVESITAIPNDTTYIACDWGAKTEFYKLVCKFRGKHGIAFYNNSFISDIWNGTSYKKFRAQFNYLTLPLSCRGCDFLNQKRLQYLSTEESGFKLIKKEKRI